MPSGNDTGKKSAVHQPNLAGGVSNSKLREGMVTGLPNFFLGTDVGVYQENQQPRLGASVFGPNEVYTKLKAFKTYLLSKSKSGVL